MGAWGESPVDNDTAADWFGDELEKAKLSKRIERGLKSKDEDVQRAAAWLLERLAYTYVYDINKINEHLDLAIEKLERLLDNNTWIESWKDSSAIKRSLRKQISGLRALQSER